MLRQPLPLRPRTARCIDPAGWSDEEANQFLKQHTTSRKKPVTNTAQRPARYRPRPLLQVRSHRVSETDIPARSYRRPISSETRRHPVASPSTPTSDSPVRQHAEGLRHSPQVPFLKSHAVRAFPRGHALNREAAQPLTYTVRRSAARLQLVSKHMRHNSPDASGVLRDPTRHVCFSSSSP